MTRIRVEHVTKRYGRTVAVRDVSFVVEDGEFVALLGPSGCGKTSTLRMIAGLERIDEGAIYFDDRVVNDVDPRHRNVAMAFENYGLYPHWDCYRNIAYPLRLRGVREEDVRRRVEEIARKLRVDTVLGRKPAEVAGGVRQRVGLARALVRDPTVFLLDEPMSHVDPELRSDLRAELKRLHEDLGGTMVFVTHDQLEALELADRVIVMNDGQILQDADPDTIFDSPSSVFVGGFVGEPPMNFLPCVAEAPGAGLSLEAGDGGRVEMPQRYAATASSLTDRRLLLGVRPHAIEIRHAQTSDARGAVPGRIYMVEPLGDETVVTVKVGDHVLKVEAAPGFSAELDETVHLAFDPAHVVLFDGETEQAIV